MDSIGNLFDGEHAVNLDCIGCGGGPVGVTTSLQRFVAHEKGAPVAPLGAMKPRASAEAYFYFLYGNERSCLPSSVSCPVAPSRLQKWVLLFQRPVNHAWR